MDLKTAVHTIHLVPYCRYCSTYIKADTTCVQGMYVCTQVTSCKLSTYTLLWLLFKWLQIAVNHTCTHTYIRTHMYTHIRTHTIYTLTSTHIHTYTHTPHSTYAHTYVHTTNTHTDTHLTGHTHTTHTPHAQAYTHHTHTYTLHNTHTHTHTHTQNSTALNFEGFCLLLNLVPHQNIFFFPSILLNQSESFKVIYK